MTSFKPTPEQTAIIEHITSRSENLAVIARAGAAKTTTLELAARAHSTPTLYLCFNKKIADEASERMPSHVACRTLNGLGHRAWAQQLNKRLYLEKRKSFDLLKFHILDDFKGEDQELLNENFADLLRVMSFAKQSGYVPDRGGWRTARPLCTDDEFFAERCPYELEDVEVELIQTVMTESVNRALQAAIDFDDQIYMPTIFPCTFDRYPLVMVDEAQDLSLLNHAMLRKITKRSRLVAVGDPCQAI